MKILYKNTVLRAPNENRDAFQWTVNDYIPILSVVSSSDITITGGGVPPASSTSVMSCASGVWDKTTLPSRDRFCVIVSRGGPSSFSSSAGFCQMVMRFK